ncbi:MAG: ATP-binding region ATPase domain protein [Firmicutes bacterium]|nr:ATP-binding region ATPase domain protein [Bacillota bacterium]
MMRELSLHILDLVQNAIEAGANKVRLDIVEDMSEMDTLLIRVIDNGQGMDDDTCQKVIDPFVTSRTTRRVGLGLPLIDMSTKRCAGYLTIVSTPGSGTVVEALYKHSHWDRPPLGNIVETVKSIIIAHPELNFSYSHTVEKNVFSMVTQELTEILGNISLTQPDVLIWLHEYLTQNIMNLYNSRNLYGGVQDENN